MNIVKDTFSIRKTSFEYLVNLTELDLSKNEMTSLDPEVFSYIPKLETLDLSGNPVGITESMFVHLKGLRNLTLNEDQVDADVEEFIRKSYKLTFRE